MADVEDQSLRDIPPIPDRTFPRSRHTTLKIRQRRRGILGLARPPGPQSEP
jgi:hypothetical protein